MPRFLYFLPPLFALVLLALFPRWTVDDAFIYFRYAENLAEHGELNWNVGEDPVEGYTGIAMPLVLAVWIKAGGAPVVAAKAIGLSCYFLTGLALFGCLTLLRVREIVRAGVLLLYFTAPLMFTHAWSGLETTWFSAGLSSSLLLGLLCLDARRPAALYESLFTAVLLMTSLVRPEGAALAAAYGIAIGLARLHAGRREFAVFALRFAIFYILPGSLYFLWRYNYYGHLLPNTFYAKASPEIWNAASLRSMTRFFYIYVLVPCAGAGLSLWFSRPGGPWADSWITKGHRYLAGATLAFLALVFLQYSRSIPVMNYAYRFFAPYFPFFLIAAGIAGSRAIDEIQAFRSPQPAYATMAKVFAVFLILLQLALHAVQLPGEIAYARRYQRILENVHMPTAKYLRDTLGPEDRLIVYLDAGVIPYLSGLPTVDFGELNDETLAAGNLDDQARIDYFFSQNADVAVFTSKEWDRVVYCVEAENIIADPRFEKYVLARKFRTNATKIRAREVEFVYLRSDRNPDRSQPQLASRVSAP